MTVVSLSLHRLENSAKPNWYLLPEFWQQEADEDQLQMGFLKAKALSEQLNMDFFTSTYAKVTAAWTTRSGLKISLRPLSKYSPR